MPPVDRSPSRVALRSLGTVVAIVAAGVAVWLVVRGSDSRTVQFGVLLGLFAAVLAAVSLLAGGRARVHPEQARADLENAVEVAARRSADLAAREAVADAARNGSGGGGSGSGEVERRRTAEVERERDEATRREFAMSLELMLRREMERVMRSEVDSLRQEVAALRNDLTEKVPGQIRLERIETTRLIGSDLEALQAEVRRLAGERAALGVPAGELPAGLGIVAHGPGEIRAAEVVEHGLPSATRRAPAAPPAAAAPDASAAPMSTTPAAVRTPTPPPVATAPADWVPAAAWPPPSAPAPAAAPAASPVPDPAPAQREPTLLDRDPFASLPRLSRWEDPYAGEPDPPPLRSVPAPAPDPAPDPAPNPSGTRGAADGTAGSQTPEPRPAGTGAGRGSGHHAVDEVEQARYVGRRRQGVAAADGLDGSTGSGSTGSGSHGSGSHGSGSHGSGSHRTAGHAQAESRATDTGLADHAGSDHAGTDHADTGTDDAETGAGHAADADEDRDGAASGPAGGRRRRDDPRVGGPGTAALSDDVLSRLLGR